MRRKLFGTIILLIFAFLVSFGFINPNFVFAESTANTLPHKTDFLTLIQGQPLGTTWYPTKDPATRTAYRNALKNKGYTHAYLSVTSSKAGHNYFSDPVGFKNLLQELVNDGIKPVVWLTSDSGTWRNKPISEIKSDLSKFVPVVDSLVNSYEVGLEANEYWTKSETDEIGNYLDSLTSKPLAVHQTPGKWDYCTSGWCDYMILQYGFGHDVTYIKNKTNEAINSLGKPVVAGEYNTNENNTSLSITLGNAALDACAAGFGNGGTASNVKYPNCGGGPTATLNPNTPTPTSSVNVKPDAQSQTVSTGQGQAVEIQLQFIDPDGPGPYTYTITDPPDHGTLTGTDNDRTYTPNSSFTGTDSFKWKVKDGLLDSNIATTTINIGGSKPGDANNDNKVDGLDYVIWLNNYGKTVTGGATKGDFNTDGKVDGLDYVIWLTNYGT